MSAASQIGNERIRGKHSGTEQTKNFPNNGKLVYCLIVFDVSFRFHSLRKKDHVEVFFLSFL